MLPVRSQYLSHLNYLVDTNY